MRIKSILKAFAVMLCIIVAAVCTSCTANHGEDENKLPAQSELPSGEVGNTENALTGCEIETPVGMLYYPEEYESYLDVKTESSEDEFSAEFYAKLDQEAILLFDLSMGEQKDGYLLGSVKNDGQLRSVWLNIQEIERKANWSDEEAQRVADMQERVNDVIDQIYQLEGFCQTKPR